MKSPVGDEWEVYVVRSAGIPGAAQRRSYYPQIQTERRENGGMELIRDSALLERGVMYDGMEDADQIREPEERRMVITW
jgi:hypothetical protein